MTTILDDLKSVAPDKHAERYKPLAAYDTVSHHYDALYQSQEAVAENMAIFGRIGFHVNKYESVLDVGCGTGLFLDYANPKQYLGIDPSGEMIRELHRKHPHAPAMITPFEHFHTPAKFDLVCGLFGSPSYIDPDHIDRLARMAKRRLFLMFYAKGYRPELHAHLADMPAIHVYDERWGVGAPFKSWVCVDINKADPAQNRRPFP